MMKLIVTALFTGISICCLAQSNSKDATLNSGTISLKDHTARVFLHNAAFIDYLNNGLAEVRIFSQGQRNEATIIPRPDGFSIHMQAVDGTLRWELIPLFEDADRDGKPDQPAK